MRHSNVGPATNKPKLGAAPIATTAAVGSTSSTSSTSPSLPSPSSAGVVRVFAADVDAFPLAQFEGHSSVQHVLATLKLANGGLKTKGGQDTFLGDHTKLPAGDYVVIGSAGVRLRVVWKGNKLIVPYPFPTHQVQQLMEEVASRFARFHTGESELKMSELRTLDGYLVNKYDRIMEAVYDGDQLEAIDFDSWLKEQAQLCKEKWLQVSQADFVDDTPKWAIVGKHAHGKLFVQTGAGKKVDRLELFELEDLKMFAKEGQQQILTSKGKSEGFDWFASASFVVNGTGQVTHVVVEVKSLSDPRPIVKKFGISIENGVLVKGDVTLVQSADEDAGEDPNPLPLPLPKREETLLVDPPQPTEPVPLLTVQGMQKLKIEQVEKVYADQTWASRGFFNNNFFMNFSFTNPGDNVVTIAKIKTEYESAPNNWVEGKNSAIGHKQGFYDYRWNWDTQCFTIPSHSVEKVAFLCSIPISAPQVDRLRRGHKSLPNPLKIRLTLEDDQGATTQLEVVHHNDPYKLPSKESVEKSQGKEFEYFVTLDDAETEIRHYISVARVQDDDTKEHIEIRSSVSSSSFYLYKTDMRRFAFSGVKNNSELVDIEAVHQNENGSELKAYAMVDLQKKRTYAIKFSLKTETGAFLEDYYRVKPLKYID
jgi:hypothetical protein